MDLKALLLEAKQKVPPVLQVLHCGDETMLEIGGERARLRTGNFCRADGGTRAAGSAPLLVGWLCLTPFFPLQGNAAVLSAAAWAIASPTAPSWRRCRPSKSATSAARTTWHTAPWTSSPPGFCFPVSRGSHSKTQTQPWTRGAVLRCCGLVLGLFSAQTPALGGGVWSSTLLRGAGQAGGGTQGDEEAPGAAAPAQWCVQGLTHCPPEPLSLAPIPRYLVPCILSSWLFPLPPKEPCCSWAVRTALASGAPLRASLALAACVLPRCPAARGRADGHLPWPSLCPSSHTPKRGSLREGSLPHTVTSAAITFLCRCLPQSQSLALTAGAARGPWRAR